MGRRAAGLSGGPPGGERESRHVQAGRYWASLGGGVSVGPGGGTEGERRGRERRGRVTERLAQEAGEGAKRERRVRAGEQRDGGSGGGSEKRSTGGPKSGGRAVVRGRARGWAGGWAGTPAGGWTGEGVAWERGDRGQGALAG